MRLRWTPAAAQDLEAIKRYLDFHLPHLSKTTILRLYDGIRELKSRPARGRPGRFLGTRELILSPLPYIVVYRIHDEAIEVLHIHHGAQDWG